MRESGVEVGARGTNGLQHDDGVRQRPQAGVAFDAVGCGGSNVGNAWRELISLSPLRIFIEAYILLNSVALAIECIR